MADRDLFIQTLKSFAGTMASSFDRTEMCLQLCDATSELIDGSGAGVAVAAADGTLQFVVATNERIIQLEKVQERLQQGPCVAAFSSQQPVRIENISQMAEWPGFRDSAELLEIHSGLGFPLTIGSHRVGSLNIYADAPRTWSEEDLATIAVLADMATAYLVRVSELQEAHELSAQLQGALDSRIIIEQAKGMVANQLSIGVDQAFELIRGYARSHQLQLTALAHTIVNMGLHLPPPD
jgi:GAF domain-containing protein